MSNDEPRTDANQPVTVVVTRTVKPGRERDYEEWLHGVGAAAHAFPGHMGLNVIRPHGAASREYTLIFRFDTVDRLRAWQDSELCREWVKKAADLCTAEAPIQKLTGMEAWFTVPTGSQPPPPPRFKMAAVSFLAAFPLIQLLNRFLIPQLSFLPPLLRGAVVVAVMVTLLTYVVMPRMSRWFAFWLYPAVKE